MDEPVSSVLNKLLLGIGLRYKMTSEKVISISIEDHGIPSPPQQVSGVITDEKGAPVFGASVVLKPGNRGTSTNNDGRFVFSAVEPGEYTLEVSYIGYETKTQKVTVSSSSPLTVNIQLGSQRQQNRNNCGGYSLRCNTKEKGFGIFCPGSKIAGHH